MIFYFPSAFLTIALYLAELAEAEVSILNGSNKKLKKMYTFSFVKCGFAPGNSSL